MSDAAPLPRPPAWFFASLGALTLCFVAIALSRANRTTLRGDEIAGILHNRGERGLADLLLRGEVNQISPAPLYYITHLATNAARSRLNYLGLTPPGYYRLPSILFTAGFGVAAAVVLALRLRREQTGAVPLVLVLCALAVFWFQPKAFAFAGIVRPYALWNDLWFFAAVLLLCRPGPGIAAAVVLSLLAATATVACFQILALGFGATVVRALERRPLRDILREGALLLAGPALIGAYYALRSKPFAMDDRDTGEASVDFLKFWLVTTLPAWIAGAFACGLTLSRPKLRPFAPVAVAFAALLLLMPLIFGLAHYKGYASPSRQYIWTTTGIPILLLVVALGWADLRTWKPATPSALVVATALTLGFMGVTLWKPLRRNDSRDLACLESGSSLSTLLRTERPAALLLEPDVKLIEGANAYLIGEWIDVRHADRPRGTRSVALTDRNGRLEARDLADIPSSVERDVKLPCDLMELYRGHVR